MRFTVVVLMLAALPLLAMGATRGPSSGLSEYKDPDVT
jgi:hypothetical protein